MILHNILRYFAFGVLLLMTEVSFGQTGDTTFIDLNEDLSVLDLGCGGMTLAKYMKQTFNVDIIGVDLVLDKDQGPLILEMNARPGLNIQIANRAGLLPRLQLVERRQQDLPSIEDRIAFSKERFGA